MIGALISSLARLRSEVREHHQLLQQRETALGSDGFLASAAASRVSDAARQVNIKCPHQGFLLLLSHGYEWRAYRAGCAR